MSSVFQKLLLFAAIIFAGNIRASSRSEKTDGEGRNPWQIGPSVSYTLESQDLTGWACGLHVAKSYDTRRARIKLVPKLSYFYAFAHKIAGYRPMPLHHASVLFGPRFMATDVIFLEAKIGAHVTGKHYVWNQGVLDCLRTYNVQIGYVLKRNQSELGSFSLFYNHSYAMKHYTNFLGMKVQAHL